MGGSTRYLFICGCPRSGTTAMWSLLTAAPDIVLGLERYGTRMFASTGGLSPDLFQAERFFDVRPGDTFYNDLDAFHPYYRAARTRFADAAAVGDKLPKLYMRFQALATAFPQSTVVFMLRNIYDVASSYKKRAADPEDATWRRGQGVSAAIDDWTHSIAAFQAFAPTLDVVPVVYEELFVEGRGIDALCRHVGLTVTDAVTHQYRNLLARSTQLERDRDRSLTVREVNEICMRAPFGGFRKIVEHARQRSSL